MVEESFEKQENQRKKLAHLGKKNPTASKCIFLEKDLSRTAGSKNYPGIGNYWKSAEDVGMLKLDLLFI